MMLLPRTGHVPRCGRNLALELRSVCETDALQRHEESTALKTLPHAAANWHGDCDRTQVIRVCSWRTVVPRTGLPDQERTKREESIVRKLIGVIALCLVTFPALCQSTSKYQIGFITEVKPRQATGDGTSDPTSYDVSCSLTRLDFSNKSYLILRCGLAKSRKCDQTQSDYAY